MRYESSLFLCLIASLWRAWDLLALCASAGPLFGVARLWPSRRARLLCWLLSTFSCQCAHLLRDSIVSDKVIDAPGARSIASNKFGTLSVEPILDACSILIVVSDKFDTLRLCTCLV